MGKKKSHGTIVVVLLILLAVGGYYAYNKYFKDNIPPGDDNPPVNNTFTGMCYQETATQGTTCGGLSTGKYFATTVNAPSGYEDLYINYSKPTKAVSAVWQVKWTGGGSTKTLNYTVPASCFQRDKLEFVIAVYATQTTGMQNFYAMCKPITGSWINIISSFSNGLPSGFTASSAGLIYDGDWNTGVTQIINSGTGGGGWKVATTPIIAVYEEGVYWNITG